MTNPALMEPLVQQERQLKLQQPPKGTKQEGQPLPQAERAWWYFGAGVPTFQPCVVCCTGVL